MEKLIIFLRHYSKILILTIFLILLSSILWKFLYQIFNPPISITAEFYELGPLYKKMPVYYKGYKIGKTNEIKPSNDYKATLVEIEFYPRNLKLPENISAKVKKLNNGIDYINLEYPKTPSNKTLKRGSVIHGATSLDIQSFMSAQAESGVLGSITENANSTLSVFAQVGKDASTLIKTITITVNENRNSIKKSINNLNQATKNLNDIATKLNKSLSPYIENATYDISQSVKNTSTITNDIKNSTKNLPKTMAKIDNTICEINEAAANINDITKGLKETLQKNFGTLKIIMGKPINEQKCYSTSKNF